MDETNQNLINNNFSLEKNSRLAGDKNLLSLDEKLKMALMNEPNCLEEDSERNNKPMSLVNQQENITGTTVASNIFNNTTNSPDANNISNKEENLQQRKIFSSISPTQLPSKKQKIFKIKKYVKYNKFLAEICSDEEISDSDKLSVKDSKANKISPFSKVNFSKLKAEEKDERLKNLAKLVKRLRRKARNLEHKLKFNATKLLNKYIWNKLGINAKNKYLQPEFQFDFEKICKALKKVKNYDEFEYDDQKHLIENIINLVAEDKLKPDSLAYKKICSILRTLIPKDRIKYISKKDSKITISFPETEVCITNKEYQRLSKFKDNEDILRAVLGIYDPDTDKVVKVTSEPPEPLATTNASNNPPQTNLQTNTNLGGSSNVSNLNNLNTPQNINMTLSSINPLTYQLMNQTTNQRMTSYNQMNPFLQHNFSSFLQGQNNNNLHNSAGLFSNINCQETVNQQHNLQQLLLQSYGSYFQNPLSQNNLGNISNGRIEARQHGTNPSNHSTFNQLFHNTNSLLNNANPNANAGFLLSHFNSNINNNTLGNNTPNQTQNNSTNSKPNNVFIK